MGKSDSFTVTLADELQDQIVAKKGSAARLAQFGMDPDVAAYLSPLITGGTSGLEGAPVAPRYAALASGVFKDQLFAVANHGAVPNTVRVASGTQVRADTRRRTTTGNADLTEIRFVFCHYWQTTAGETVPPNDLTIEMALEWPGVSTQRVTFNGANSGTLTAGVAEYISDPIYPAAFGRTAFPKNTLFYMRMQHTAVATLASFPRYNGSTRPAKLRTTRTACPHRRSWDPAC